MKHLYRIDVEHSAPKDSLISIAGYVIADSKEKVYDYLANEEDKHHFFNSWADKDQNGPDKENELEDDELENSENNQFLFEDEVKDENGNWVTLKETWKTRMLRYDGELGDESRPYEDLYYGLTYYGWTDLGEVSEVEIEVLKKTLLNDIVLIN